MYNKQDFKNAHGKKISQSVLEHILSNFYLWKHSIEKLKQRSDLVVEKNGEINKFLTKKNIVEDIRNNMILAYYNTDGSVNIAVDDYIYYVFEYQDENSQHPDKWLLYTYKEPSWYGIDIYEKQQLAIKGVDRK